MSFFKPDSWAFAKDKQGHFAIGAMFTAVVLLAGLSSFLALLGVLIVAFSKEIYDHFHQDVHTPSLVDAAYTCIGGVVGVYASMVIGAPATFSLAAAAFLITQKLLK